MVQYGSYEVATVAMVADTSWENCCQKSHPQIMCDRTMPRLYVGVAERCSQTNRSSDTLSIIYQKIFVLLHKHRSIIIHITSSAQRCSFESSHDRITKCWIQSFERRGPSCRTKWRSMVQPTKENRFSRWRLNMPTAHCRMLSLRQKNTAATLPQTRKV